jgi:glycosyltransferase involved in cell wall biosynthesis
MQTDWYQLIHPLQGLYLRENAGTDKLKYLNAISGIYEEAGKTSLSLFCYCESLSIDRKQAHLIEKIESLKARYRPHTPETVPPDGCGITVIIPTRNRVDELTECVRSVLNQEYTDYEILVVNDGGTDQAENALSSFGSGTIRYLKLEGNMGPSRARNEAIRRARGKYIAYLDDDDVYYPNHLGLLSDYLETHPATDAVYSDSWWVYGNLANGKFVPKFRKRLERRPDAYDRDLLCRYNWIVPMNMMHRKSVFASTGIFNEEISKFEDWELFLRFSLKLDIAQVNDITGEYRWKENNASIVGNREMVFLFPIIRRFYSLYFGNVALAKACLESRDMGKTMQYIKEIEDCHASCFRTAELYDELSDLVDLIRPGDLREEVIRRLEASRSVP